MLRFEGRLVAKGVLELSLQRFEGRTPIELLGRVPFPRIGELPYLLTLEPYGFYWFQIAETPLQ